MSEKKIQLKNGGKDLGVIIEDPKITIRKMIRKTTIISVSVLLMAILAIILISQNINQKATDLQAKQNLIYRTNQQAKTNTELVRQWLEISPNIDKINNSLPNATSLLTYMGELENIASETGVSQNVKIQSPAASGVSTSAPAAAAKGGSIDYTIELKGTFAQFDDYLQQLEKAPYYTQITAVSYVGTDTGTDSSATIRAKIYTFGN